MHDLFGIKIHESPYCNRIVSVRQHKKRRNQKESYHRRIQKKWTKRYGTKTEKVAYLISGSVFGREMIVMHPEHVALISNLGA